MKIEEPAAMYEVHKTRIKIWEEEKKLSTKERIIKHRKELKKFIEKHHLENRIVILTKS